MNDFKIEFKWVGAATWVLQVDAIKIACDPVLCSQNTIIDFNFFKAKRVTAPQYIHSDFSDVDIWLLTHNHADHIDELGMGQISDKAYICAHTNLRPWFKNSHSKHLFYMKWGQKKQLSINGYQITIEAITCVHGSNFISTILCGGVNGYWITIRKGNNSIELYVTGDTINHSKVKKHIQGSQADILIPNMGGSGLDKFGGPFSYTAELLKDTVSMTQPKIILPVHHTTFSLNKEPISELYKWNDNRVIKFKEGETVVL